VYRGRVPGCQYRTAGAEVKKRGRPLSVHGNAQALERGSYDRQRDSKLFSVFP
jgi:hypothetical protein